MKVNHFFHLSSLYFFAWAMDPNRNFLYNNYPFPCVFCHEAVLERKNEGILMVSQAADSQWIMRMDA